MIVFFCFRQKTGCELRISDGSSDVCSSDLTAGDRASDRRLQRFKAAIAPRQVARSHLPDMPDAEREQEAVKRRLPPRIDRRHQIVDRQFPPTLALDQLALARVQPEDIGGRMDQPVAGKTPDCDQPNPFEARKSTRLNS